MDSNTQPSSHGSDNTSAQIPPADRLPKDKEERLDALRAIAGMESNLDAPHQARHPATSRIGTGAPQRRQLTVISSWSVAIAVILILTLIIAAILHGSMFSPPAKSANAATVTFFPETSSGIECPHDATWSPDGAKIAIVGYKATCLGGATDLSNTYQVNMLQSSTPGLLTIYDAHTGRLLTTLHPDDLILAHITLSAPVTALLGNPQINSGPLLSFNYTHVLWSHDGRHLALTFNGFIPTGIPATMSAAPIWPGYQVDGVLTLDATGASPHVLFQRFDPNHPVYTEWDLSQGIALTEQQALQPPSSFTTLQPAERYQWESNGVLSPLALFASSSAFASAPSTASAGSSFPFWQSGYALPLATSQQSDAAIGWNAYIGDIATWSPDGRYLLERGTIEILVTASPHPSASAIPTGWNGAPSVSAIPAGFAQVYQRLGGQSTASGADFIAVRQPSMSSIPVAWNPETTRLAAYSSSEAHVLIFDMRSGVQVASLKPVANLNATQTYRGIEASMLRWSPDGSRLLLYDPAIGTATIWQMPLK